MGKRRYNFKIGGLSLLKTIYKECMQFKTYFISLNLFLIIVYLCELIIPYVFSQFIDTLTSSPSGSALIKGPVIIIILTTLFLLIASYFKSILSELTTLKVSNRLLNRIDTKLEHLPLRETAKHNPAYLNSSIFNDILTSVGFAIDNLIVAIIMFMSTLILFYMIGSIHIFMLGIVFLALFINVISILFLNKALYKRGYAYRDQNNHYLSANHDRLAHIKETKIHAWYAISGEQVDLAFGKLLTISISLNKVLALLNNIGTLTKNITLILTMIVGGKLLLDQTITIGQLVLITSYTTMCLSNSEFFLKLGQSFQHAKVCFSRLEEFLNVADEKNGTLKVEKINTIAVKDLSFAYPEMAPLYTDLNLTFHKGKIYCLKGKNGDGKSTFLDLLLGLNDGYEGSIMIEGMPISTIDMQLLRKEKISVILQEPTLQRIPVKDNMLRGLTTHSSQTLKDLCKYFRVEKIIHSNDATSLSGGEKQKIAVIRGLLKQSELLILDEPVSAMDTSGIEHLKEALLARKDDKIIIFISHNEELFDIVDEFIDLSTTVTN